MNKPIHPAVAEHVMQENVMLRGLLVEVAHCLRTSDEQPLYWEEKFASRIYRDLSQQAEPVGTAPAQDEREVAKGGDPSIVCWTCKARVSLDDRADADGSCPHCSVELDLEEYLRAELTRPAQTEQQPIRMPTNELQAVLAEVEGIRDSSDVAYGWYEATDCISRLNAEPVAQTAPQPEQSEPVEALEHVSEGAEMLQSLIDNIETKGNYSTESTLLFLNQALGCIRIALAAQGGRDDHC